MEKRPNNCKICKKSITRRAELCLSCSNSIKNRGENNYAWKGGKPKCKKCGKLITHKSIYCKKCLVQYDRRGKNNPNWKNFKTTVDLYNSIRQSSEYCIWRNDVLKRDNYICQECGHIGRPIEVHHLKSFGIIFKEFLKYYSQFSPIDDKETLLRLTLTYKDFWYLSNGQSLCKNCHKKTKFFIKYPPD